MSRGTSHTAYLIEEVNQGEMTVHTVRVSGSGVWTLISHADGYGFLTSPSGKVLDMDSPYFHDSAAAATPQVAAILNWMERYF